MGDVARVTIQTRQVFGAAQPTDDKELEMQDWIVLAIVGLAAGFLVNRWRRAARELASSARGCAGACGCGRSGASAAAPSKTAIKPIHFG
ncbi:MAG: hypothetical protein CFK52_11685 [Chloracidobacterium sp. CP2_5A]|nr:MAG: hypothetical protein CFK52_11685 [Chloracidobacterium sp. CP2_5A]